MSHELNFPLPRRGFLTATAAVGGGAILSCATRRLGEGSQLRSPSDAVFPYAVASGDPGPTDIVLWTAIAPEFYSRGEEQLDQNRGLSVDIWPFNASSPDSYPDRKETVRRVSVDSSESNFSPSSDYTASVLVDGLEPHTRYNYQFVYDDGQKTHRSPIGRCKTFPSKDQDIQEVQFGLTTCHDYTTGYFGALGHLSRQKLDFVICVGDFIYEYERFPGVTGHQRTLPAELSGDDGIKRAHDLATFRAIHKTYRKDPMVQEALRMHSWIMIWDDHELGNNAYYDYELLSAGLGYDPNDPHPFALTSEEAARIKRLGQSKALGQDVTLREKLAKVNVMRQGAQQDWLEYTPAKIDREGFFLDQAARPVKLEDAHSRTKFYKAYREFNYGRLMDLFVTDSRSFRSRPGCMIRADCENKNETKMPPRYGGRGFPLEETKATMLGAQQAEWLKSGLTRKDGALWKVWGNQTFFSPLQGFTSSLTGGQFRINQDAWDGFDGERKDILKALSVEGANDGRLVILTGDFHTVFGSLVLKDFDKLRDKTENTLGVELMTPSMTSPNFFDSIGAKTPAPLSQVIGKLGQFGIEKMLGRANPHIRFFRCSHYGYSTVRLTKGRAGTSNCYWKIFNIDKLQDVQVSEIDKIKPISVDEVVYSSERRNFLGMQDGLQCENISRNPENLADR